VQKEKTNSPKSKSKGGRPRKETELHSGEKAATRFTAAMIHVLKAGPHVEEKP